MQNGFESRIEFDVCFIFIFIYTLLFQVLLFTWNVTNQQNISGEQLGAYFGYSLCVNDIDGDGRDDLIVGAPLYTDFTNNLEHYETGRVYIFYQGKEVRKGGVSRLRFRIFSNFYF
jgi:hypothetical protein